MENTMITTAFELPGYQITKSLGIVRGVTVSSTSLIGGFTGFIQSLFGGNIASYTSICEQARSETFSLMRRHAQSIGANAIIGVRYDATDFGGLVEILCYGTAVIASTASDPGQKQADVALG